MFGPSGKSKTLLRFNRQYHTKHQNVLLVSYFSIYSLPLCIYIICEYILFLSKQILLSGTKFLHTKFPINIYFL